MKLKFGTGFRKETPKEIAGAVDPSNIPEQSGRDGYRPRYSSTYIFAMKILHLELFFHWNTALALYMMIILMAKDPNSEAIFGNLELWNYSTIFLALAMVFEMVIVAIVYGWWKQSNSYLRTHYLDVIVLVSMALEAIINFWELPVPVFSFAGMRCLRVLKGIQSLTYLNQVQSIFDSLKRALAIMLNIGLAMLFISIFVCVFTVQLFSGVYDESCRNRVTDLFLVPVSYCDSNNVGDNSTCPAGFYCSATETLPSAGLQSFDNSFFVFVSSFAILSTSDDWTRSQILPTWQKFPAGRYWTALYFYVQVVLMAFIIINLFIAAISSTLVAVRKNMSDDREEEDAATKDDEATGAIRQLASTSGNPSLILKHTRNQIDGHLQRFFEKTQKAEVKKVRVTVNAFKRRVPTAPVKNNRIVPIGGVLPTEVKSLPTTSLRYARLDQKIRYFRFQVIKLVNDPKFEFFVAALVCLNTLSLGTVYRGMSDSWQNMLQYLEIFFTIIFVLEMLLKWFAFGLRKYFADKSNVFDATVILFSLVDFVLSVLDFNIPNISVLRMFRLLRFVRALKRIKKLWQLFQVLIKSFKGLINLLAFTGFLMSAMAIVGKELLGGYDFYEGTEPVRFSWNTFPQAFLLLFQLLTADSWTVTMLRYMNARRDPNTPENTAYELDVAVAAFLFHMICYVVTNYILLNLLIVVILEHFEISDEDRIKEYLALLAENDEHVKMALSSQKSDMKHFFDRISRWISVKKVAEEAEVARITSASSIDELLPKAEPVAVDPFTGNLQDPIPSENESNKATYDASAAKNSGDAAVQIDSDSPKASIPVDKSHSEQPIGRVRSASVESRSTVGSDSENSRPTVTGSMALAQQLWSVRAQKFKYMWIIKCKKLSDSNAFPFIVYSVIILSSLELAMQTPSSRRNIFDQKPYVYIDYLFWAIFMMEFLVLVSLGWCSYFANPWNFADFSILMATSVENTFSLLGLSGEGSILRIFRLARCVRPLRLLNKNESIRAVINALIESMPSVFYVVLLYFFLTVTFAILGMQLFMAKFDVCNDATAIGFFDCSGPAIFADQITGLGMSILKPRAWLTPSTNFDNAGNAIITLFRITTLQWTRVYFQIIDSVDVDVNAIQNYSTSTGAYIFAYVFCSTFFIMNLFVAVIIEYFTTCTGSKLLTGSQKAWVRTRRYLSSLNFGMIPKPKGIRGHVYALVTHRFFEGLILFAIVCNGVLMLAQHKNQSPLFDDLMERVNNIILVLFSVEMLAKILAFQISGYLSDSWNKFDCTLVIFSVLMYFFAGQFQFAGQITRLFRLLRLIKLVKKATALKSLIEALYISLPALGNICLLVLLVMWIFAVIGVSQFGDLKEGYAIATEASASSFNGFVPALITLFNLLVGENWDNLLDEASTEYPYCTRDDPKAVPEVFGDCGSQTTSQVYFVSFYVFTFFILVNLFIAVVVENVSFCYEDIEGFITDDDIAHFGNIFTFHSSATVRILGEQRGFKTFADYLKSFRDSNEVPPLPNPHSTIHRSAVMRILQDLKDNRNGQKLALGSRMNPLSGNLLRLIGRRHYLCVWHEISMFCQKRLDEEATNWSSKVYKRMYGVYLMMFAKATKLASLAMKFVVCRRQVRAEPNARFRAAARRLMEHPELRKRIAAVPLAGHKRKSVVGANMATAAQLSQAVAGSNSLKTWSIVSAQTAEKMRVRESENLTFAQLFIILVKWAIPLDHLTIVEQMERKEEIIECDKHAAVRLFVASFRGHMWRKLKRLSMLQAKGNMMRAARLMLANQSATRLKNSMTERMNAANTAETFEELPVVRRASSKHVASAELEEQTIRFERMGSRMKMDMKSSSKKCAQVHAAAARARVALERSRACLTLTRHSQLIGAGFNSTSQNAQIKGLPAQLMYQ